MSRVTARARPPTLMTAHQARGITLGLPSGGPERFRFGSGRRCPQPAWWWEPGPRRSAPIRKTLRSVRGGDYAGRYSVVMTWMGHKEQVSAKRYALVAPKICRSLIWPRTTGPTGYLGRLAPTPCEPRGLAFGLVPIFFRVLQATPHLEIQLRLSIGGSVPIAR